MPTITLGQAEQKIFEWFTLASPREKEQGMVWYFEAHEECKRLAELHNIPLWMVAGVVAALSPRCKWESNIEYAARLLMGDDSIPIVKGNVAKAHAILNGEHPTSVLGGPKTLAFFDNLLDPHNSQAATIDTWIARCVWSKHTHPAQYNGNFRANDYAIIEQACKNVAQLMGLIPHQVQAIAWVAVRHGQNYGDQLSLF